MAKNIRSVKQSFFTNGKFYQYCMTYMTGS